jgi:hypothetical protein
MHATEENGEAETEAATERRRRRRRRRRKRQEEDASFGWFGACFGCCSPI